MADGRSYITVELGANKWALSTACVEEIVPIYNFYEAPEGSADYVIGVINYRGSLIKLIDAKKVLIGEKNIIRNSNKVLVVKKNNSLLALLVDDVEDIISVEQPESNSYFTYMHYTYRLIDLERIFA